MKYRQKVLARYPNAQAIVVETYPAADYGVTPSGREHPRRVVIRVPRGAQAALSLTTSVRDQGYGAAWRDAYVWCCRHPEAKS